MAEDPRLEAAARALAADDGNEELAFRLAGVSDSARRYRDVYLEKARAALEAADQADPHRLTVEQRALIRRAIERNRQWEPHEDIAFIQKVAASCRAVCVAHHHAGTCRGAVGLAEEAMKVLAGLGVEPQWEPSFTRPCFLCGDGRYVIGQIWTEIPVHADCASAYIERETSG